MFNCRSNYFIFNNKNKTCVFFPMHVGAPVWSSKASMYLRITLVFLTDLYMHLIFPSVESEAISD